MTRLLLAIALLLLCAAPAHAGAAEDFTAAYQAGTTAMDAGQYDEAERQLLKAHEIGRHIGPQDPRYLEAVLALAKLYRLEREWAAALPLVEAAIGFQGQPEGKDRLPLSTLLNELGVIQFRLKTYPKAEAAYTQALSIRREYLGADSPAVARVVHNLAELYRVIGEPDRSEALFKRSLADKEKAFGKDHRQLISTLNDLGLLYTTLKRYDDARAVLLRGHELARKHDGAQSETLATLAHNLGNLDYRRGAAVDAEPWFKQAIAIREQLPRRAKRGLVKSLNALANTYVALKRDASAEELYLKARDIAIDVEGPSSSAVKKVLRDYVLLLDRQDRDGEAKAVRAMIAGTPQ